MFLFGPREKCFHRGIERKHRLPVTNADLSLCKSGPLRCLDLAGSTRVSLFSRFLHVLTVEPKMKPVGTASLENGHFISLSALVLPSLSPADLERQNPCGTDR